jgi:AcrR family transcriptional regulator
MHECDVRMLRLNQMGTARALNSLNKATNPASKKTARINARGRESDNPTRERILLVAGSLFLKNGYAATGMDQISKHAGVSAPTIYWHFKSKDALLTEFLTTTVTRLRDAVYPRLNAEDPVERLRQCIYGHVVFVLRWYAHHDAHEASSGFGPLIAALPARQRKAIVASIDEYVKRFRQILADGIERGCFSISDLSITTMAIITMADHVFTWFHPEGPASIEEVGRKYAQLTVDMVRRR